MIPLPSGFAVEKVEGGKLVRARVEHDGSVMISVKITGDFFLHPEEGITLIEEALRGAPVDSTEMELAMLVMDVVEEHKLELVGVTPEAIARVVLAAAKAAGAF